MIRRTAMRPYWPMYFRTRSRALARTVPVDRVGIGVLLAVLGREVVEELLALRRVLVRRQRRHRDLHLARDVLWDAAFLRIHEAGLGHAVRPVELGVRHRCRHVLVQ